MRFAAGLLVVFSILVATAAHAAEKDKVLIVTGFDVKSHVWQETTQQAVKTLEGSGKFSVKVSEDVEVFANPSLKDFDVVVLNYGFWKHPELSDKAKAGLLEYVRSGKGLVAVHFACSSFQDWDEYGELLGRVWKQGVGGHGPFGKFTVNIKDREHPITKGLADFEVNDELYAKLSGDAEIKVLASAYSEWSEKVEPLVFVKSYGKGRVVQNVLGHGLPAREDPNFQKLLVRCVDWAANGETPAN